MKKPSIVYHDHNPFIGCYKQVVSKKECQKLIDLAEQKLQPSAIVGQSKTEISPARKSDQAQFRYDCNAIVQKVADRIASIAGQPLNHAEDLRVIRYQAGGKFDEHFDAFDSSARLGKKHITKGGQRILTALLYLNTVHAGGETFFPALSLNVPPSQGDLLVFENCRKGTTVPHPLSRHGSHPLKSGEKWISTLWFREKRQY
ncbi:prolyl hydroxylase family protein [Bacillus marinisedimentorum]|uniref:prolyl hydroxylase family protein n=1 Tax=Bacillus marinisedimentorum TaxID=1821260 RepID=UPI00087236ED|nr:2OG-Fe(II) oxygenase [Bacillus marinisedimentorum]